MERSWREWSPLEHVLTRVPLRVSGHLPGLGVDQEVTCLAAHPSYLALGTSAGMIYWYNRREDSLKRLEAFSAAVTAIAMVETVDMMLAAGNHEGDVAIFQIPKLGTSATSPEDGGGVSPSAGPGQAQDIQQFSIRGVHSRTVSALAWSLNGQKLISGDVGGAVHCSTVVSGGISCQFYYF